MINKWLKVVLAFFALLIVAHPSFAKENIVNVVDFGAQVNSNGNSQDAIDKAIEACSKNGGGIVFFPKGEYVSSTIHLKSNVKLRFDKGAILLGIQEPVFDAPEPNSWDSYQDFGHSHYKSALLYGCDLENIGIEGPGLIDGRGFTTSNDVAPGKANRGISLVRCKNITFKDFTITRCGHFGIIVNDCQDVVADNIIVDEYNNRDGFNIIGTKNVNINRSVIRGSDDGIVLKSDYSLGEDLDVENIRIQNCVLSSQTCNAFQIGSETVGNFKNIIIENCKIVEAGKAGIGITSNDGGNIDSLVFRNIKMRKTATPFFINVTSRLKAPGPRETGKISNITFVNIRAREVQNQYARTDQKWWTSTINGSPGSPVENLTFENVSICYKGGGKTEDCAVNVPELTSAASPRHLLTRPAYGWYIRHAKNICFTNCKLTLCRKDMRPAFFSDDVAGMTFDNIVFPAFKDIPIITLKNSTGIDCLRLKGVNDSFHEVNGISKVFVK